MWLRPRVENLNIDRDWWVYARHHAETRFSWAYAGLNILYMVLAGIGLFLRPRFWKAMLAYILLRSALLLTVEAPETRYTIECFPMLFVLGAGAGVPRALRDAARERMRSEVSHPSVKNNHIASVHTQACSGIGLYWVMARVFLSVLKVKASAGSA